MAKLEIYITKHCFGCVEALRLATATSSRFPTVSVRVFDLDQEPGARPAGLVAVPTYILDGRVVSLGNPRHEELYRQVELSLGGAATEEGGNGPS